MTDFIRHGYIHGKYKNAPGDFEPAGAVVHDAAMRIADIRKERGLSQADLAEMIGVEQATVSRMEKGADGVTLRIIRQAAIALRVPVADLFSERSAAEDALLKAFRSLPRERQQGWLDLARTFQGQPSKPE